MNREPQFIPQERKENEKFLKENLEQKPAGTLADYVLITCPWGKRRAILVDW